MAKNVHAARRVRLDVARRVVCDGDSLAGVDRRLQKRLHLPVEFDAGVSLLHVLLNCVVSGQLMIL